MTRKLLKILHISDLFINSRDKFDRYTILSSLIDELVSNKQKGINPEIIIVTGNVAFSGQKEEYELARGFFDELVSRLSLSNENLFLVPGNRDVTYIKYRPSDLPY